MLILSGGFTAEEFERTLNGSVFQLKHAATSQNRKTANMIVTSDFINSFSIAALIEKICLSPWTLNGFLSRVCLSAAW